MTTVANLEADADGQLLRPARGPQISWPGSVGMSALGLAGARRTALLIHNGVVYAPLSPPSTRKVDAVT